jgi:hypothetical protein
MAGGVRMGRHGLACVLTATALPRCSVRLLSPAGNLWFASFTRPSPSAEVHEPWARWQSSTLRRCSAVVDTSFWAILAPLVAPGTRCPSARSSSHCSDLSVFVRVQHIYLNELTRNG